MGKGDPTLDISQLEQLAKDLSISIKSFGQLIYDDSLFPTFPQAWEWEDLVSTDGAQPNSLILTQNAVTVTVTGTQSGQLSKVLEESAAEVSQVT